MKEKVYKDKEMDITYKEVCKYLIDQSEQILKINKKILFEMGEGNSMGQSMLENFN